MSSGKITLNLRKEAVANTLQEKLSNAPSKAQQSFNAMLTSVEEHFQMEAPVMRGFMRDATTSEYTGELSGVVYTDDNVFYKPFVVLGTAPHWIGSPVFIFQVGWRYIGMHPGTDPNDYPERARMGAEESIDSIIDNFMDYIAE